MAIHLPEKRYLTFKELEQRWQCDRGDLLHLIIAGRLRPSLWIEGIHDVHPAVDEDDEPIRAPHGWLYLHGRREAGLYDCNFTIAGKGRDFQPWENENYVLREPVALAEIEDKGVFWLTDVAAFEATRAEAKGSEEPAEKKLATRERNTLLAIIGVLAAEAKYDLETASKTAGAIESAAAAKGIDLPKRTVEEHLKKVPEALASRTR